VPAEPDLNTLLAKTGDCVGMTRLSTLLPLGKGRPRRIRRGVNVLILALFSLLTGITFSIGYAALYGQQAGGEPVVVIALGPQPAAARGHPADAVVLPRGSSAADAAGDGPSLRLNAAGSEQAAAPKTDPWKPLEPEIPIGINEIDMAGMGEDTPVIRFEENQARPGRPGHMALAPAPDITLVAEGRHGLLPVIGPDGRTAAAAYARPFDSADRRPRIAIVIGGMGLSPTTTQRAIETLPGEVSFAFAPHADNLQRLVNSARGRGHEVLVEVPMEPFDYPENDPGPNTLLTGLSAEENRDRLEWHLSRFVGHIGVTPYLGARFTADERALKPILEAIAKRGLILVEDGGSARSLVRRAAPEAGLPSGIAHRIIDQRTSRAGVESALHELEAIARSQGVAIGVGFAYPVTIEQVAEWAPTLASKGLVLAPVSAIVLKGAETDPRPSPQAGR
jgi:polysaccharide deacetylase 2 family uncharacterized protein YibQ